jgi:hypothetical protein
VPDFAALYQNGSTTTLEDVAKAKALLLADHNIPVLPKVDPRLVALESFIAGMKYFDRRKAAFLIRGILIEMETHEIDEWLSFDGELMFDPHPPVLQPGVYTAPVYANYGSSNTYVTLTVTTTVTTA